jgi:hypothetical protein
VAIAEGRVVIRIPSRLETYCLGLARLGVEWGYHPPVILIRLVTGVSWVDIEAILEHRVSDTTLRARRDECIDAGVFEALEGEALAAFDRIIGLDLDDVALNGSLHKAPYGGEPSARFALRLVSPPSHAGCRENVLVRWYAPRDSNPEPAD